MAETTHLLDVIEVKELWKNILELTKALNLDVLMIVGIRLNNRFTYYAWHSLIVGRAGSAQLLAGQGVGDIGQLVVLIVDARHWVGIALGLGSRSKGQGNKRGNKDQLGHGEVWVFWQYQEVTMNLLTIENK